MLLNLNRNRFTKNLPKDIMALFKYVVIDNLGMGQLFGEHSAIDGMANPYSVEVSSNSATVFKIDRQAMNMLFRGEKNETIGYFRGQIRMKSNWLVFKSQCL